jgi:CO/xanthine dehydrogenase FAD-binding subunit
MDMASEVLMPSSPSEAASLFGDGADTTVIGGGTVVMPEITFGRLTPDRVLLLSNAGLDGVTVEGDTITVRGQRCRRRDPRTGDGRWEPLRRPGTRGTSW